MKTNQGQIAPNDYLQRLQNFSLQVKQKVKELGVKVTWNADQTPVQYEMIPKKTIDNTCQKTIWVRCAGKDKERVSVMLLGNSLGEKKKPCIVFKQVAPTTVFAAQDNKMNRNGFGPRVWKDVSCSAIEHGGLQVFANAKAWFTSDIIVKWLQYNFPFNTELVLLLLDEFTGHQTQEVFEAAKKLNVHIMTIPPGLTSKNKKKNTTKISFYKKIFELPTQSNIQCPLIAKILL